MHLDWHLYFEGAFRLWKGHVGLCWRGSSEPQILEWAVDMGEIDRET